MGVLKFAVGQANKLQDLEGTVNFVSIGLETLDLAKPSNEQKRGFNVGVKPTEGIAP